MTMRDKIAKALFKAMSPPDGRKRYFETAPREVKDFTLTLADVAILEMKDYLRLKEMDGTASLSELTELDALDGELNTHDMAAEWDQDK
jgi:hypothetical protein